jgi:hypothetical protein
VSQNFDSAALLLVLAQAAGVVLLIGTLILLFSRRIYLDRVTHEAIEVEMPFLGKLRTQSPVIVLILIAGGLVLYPVKIGTDRVVTAPIEGQLDHPLPDVRVYVVPNRYTADVDDTGAYHLDVPLGKDTDYFTALFFQDQTQLYRQGFKLPPEGIKLQPPRIPSNKEHPKLSVPLRPTKEVSDERLKQLGIRN